MRGKTRITLNRETLKDLLERHIESVMVGGFDVSEFTVHRNGSIDVVITPARALPLEPSDAVGV